MQFGRVVPLAFLAAAAVAAPLLDDSEDLPARVLDIAASVGDAPIIGGYGKFRFQYDPTKVVMPAGTNAQEGDSHGLVLDKDNNIYLTYRPGTGDTNCLVKWDPDGTAGKTVPMALDLCTGTPHGLRIETEDDKEVLYHANNNAILHKTDLEGNAIWTSIGPPGGNQSFAPYKPTWFGAVPGSPYVFLADGYGSNYIHVFTTEGKYTGHTFGGRGTGPGKFQTCHSINWDNRTKQLIVTDRENHRHQYFDADAADPAKFEYTSEFVVDQVERPCNLRPFGEEGHAIIPDLVGPVAIVDSNNKLVSLINITDLLGDKGHLHPHDAHMLPNGDMVVCTWAPGRISYWKRLPEEPVASPGLVLDLSPDFVDSLSAQDVDTDSHFGDPADGCESDEMSVQIQGITGDFCTSKCSLFKSCPTDVPANVTAKPTCALSDASSGDKFCALICDPSAANTCGKATCKSISGTGVCTYND